MPANVTASVNQSLTHVSTSELLPLRTLVLAIAGSTPVVPALGAGFANNELYLAAVANLEETLFGRSLTALNIGYIDQVPVPLELFARVDESGNDRRRQARSRRRGELRDGFDVSRLEADRRV